MSQPRAFSRLSQASSSRQDLSNSDHRPWVGQPLSSNNDETKRFDFDTAASTRVGCIAAASLGLLLALLCLGPGIYISSTQPRLALPLPISTTAHEVLSLAINVVLTFCIDGMMFVHSVSLRWALYREGRLKYNTNIRLLTSAKQSGPNKWYSNLAAVFFLVLSYGASSVLFLENQVDDYKDATPAELASGSKAKKSVQGNLINGASLIALGIALAGQAAISVWCLLSSKTIPSWSSNPLNNALAAIQNGNIQHRPGRCMLSVHQRHRLSGQEVFPAKKQGNIFQAQRSVRYILALLWALAALAVAWPIAILVISVNMGTVYAADKWIHGGLGWRPPDWCGRGVTLSWEPTFSNCVRNVVPMMVSPYNNTHSSGWALFSPPGEAVLCILFVSAIQGGQTIGLHCVELLVNVSRDETAWRRAYIGTNQNGPGTQLTVNPMRGVLSSWEAIVLFLAKAVLHWTIGQGVLASISHGEGPPDGEEWRPIGIQFEMIYPRLFVYAVLAVALAAFATFLALRRARGYQPATMGHLQTLADLIDDWGTDEEGRMWWGDKTRLLEAGNDVAAVRHAGTGGNKAILDPIVPDGRYAGCNR